MSGQRPLAAVERNGEHQPLGGGGRLAVAAPDERAHATVGGVCILSRDAIDPQAQVAGAEIEIGLEGGA